MGAKPLSQVHHARPAASQVADQGRAVRRRAWQAHPGELGGAAADIEQQRAAAGRVAAAARSSPAPAPPPRGVGDDGRTPARSRAMHAAQELGPVGWPAGRLRWQSPECAAHRRRPSRAAQHVQRAHRPLHRQRIAQQPGTDAAPRPAGRCDEKLSSTRNPSCHTARQSAGGSCWCRGPARQTPCRPRQGDATGLLAWRQFRSFRCLPHA